MHSRRESTSAPMFGDEMKETLLACLCSREKVLEHRLCPSRSASCLAFSCAVRLVAATAEDAATDHTCSRLDQIGNHKNAVFHYGLEL